MNASRIVMGFPTDTQDIAGHGRYAPTLLMGKADNPQPPQSKQQQGTTF